MRHAARFTYIFVKIHVVQCATLPYNSHMHGSLSLGQLEALGAYNSLGTGTALLSARVAVMRKPRVAVMRKRYNQLFYRVLG